MSDVIDQNHNVEDAVFVLKFSKKPFSQRDRYRRKTAGCGGFCSSLDRQRSQEQALAQPIRMARHSEDSVQPELLTMDPDHRLGERNVIRSRTVDRL